METENSKITAALAAHYESTFDTHGATPKGVDWGSAADLELRYDQMLAVIPVTEKHKPWEVLDVGAGYGGLVTHAVRRGLNLKVTGVEASGRLCDEAARLHPQHQWIKGDVLALPAKQQFDFVVCNGILTQKLQTSHLSMNTYAHRLIEHLYQLCRRGVAFNVMSTMVNFQKDNLYHRSPLEMLAVCFELTRKVRLDHAYPLYEYTVYLYRD